MLHTVQQRCLFRRLYEPCRKLRRGCCIRRPPLHVGRRTITRAVLKRTVTNQFGIDTTIGRMVDVFIEDTIKHGAHLRPSLLGIDVDNDLCLDYCRSHSKSSHEKKTFAVHIIDCLILVLLIRHKITKTIRHPQQIISLFYDGIFKDLIDTTPFKSHLRVALIFQMTHVTQYFDILSRTVSIVSTNVVP